MSSLDDFAKAKLAELEAVHLRRTLAETVRAIGELIRAAIRRAFSSSAIRNMIGTAHSSPIRSAWMA